MHSVLSNPKEGVTEFATFDPVVPCHRVGGQPRRPLRTRHMHRPLVVQVQTFQLVRRVVRCEIDFVRVWAWSSTDWADTVKDAATECLNEGRLVVPVCVAHEGGPMRVTEACAHHPGESRGGSAHKGTPALLAASDPELRGTA